MKIGIYGGSFDPLHSGHENLVKRAENALGLDQVWFFVTPQNPFKERIPSDIHTRKSVIMKKYHSIKYKIFSTEERFKTTESFHLCRYLKRKYPQHKFCFLLGMDNAEHIHRWKNIHEIAKQMNIVFFTRKGYSAHKQSYKMHFKYQIIRGKSIEISSSFLRKTLNT